MTTGIIRRIDELGRIVIPKEIRRNLRIKTGDNLEILLEEDDIILKKYSPVENIENIINIYTDSFSKVLNYNIIVTDTDKVVAASGKLKSKYINQTISENIERIIERRESFVERKKKDINISLSGCEFGYYAVSPIINNGDSLGVVIILSLDTPILEQDEKLAETLSKMLENYFV